MQGERRFAKLSRTVFPDVRTSLITQLVKNPPAMQEIPVGFLGREDPVEKERLPIPVFLGFPCGSTGKKPTCSTGDWVWFPGLGRSPGEQKGYPLQYSGLENSMDCIARGVTKSWTRLSNFHIIVSSLFAGYWNVKIFKTGVCSQVLGSMESHREVLIHFLDIFILLIFWKQTLNI